MRLVAARLAGGLGRAVAAETWGAGNLAIGHEDGSISLYDQQRALQLVWLNPGETVSSLTAVDLYLLAGFASGTLRLLFVDTGLVVAETALPFAVTGARVLENHIACWSRLVPKLWLLQRSNLDVWRCIDTESPVLNVLCPSKGLSVVCSSHVYMLKLPDAREWEYEHKHKHKHEHEHELRLILQVDTPFLAGTLVDHRWLLLRPSGWSLFSLAQKSEKLDEEFKVDPPQGAVFYDAAATHVGTFLLSSTGATVLVRDHNIQLLEQPRRERGMWTPDAVVVSPSLVAHEARAVRGEIEWHEQKLPVSHTTTRYLMGSSDPSITAVHETYVGTAEGKLNGVTVLPAAVLRIDAERAYCALGSIALPPQKVNIVSPPRASEQLVDMRVSVLTQPYDSARSSELAGIVAGDWATLRPSAAPASAPMLALFLLEGHKSLNEILASSTFSLTTIAQLEDLAVLAATASDEPLGQTVASLLDKLWTSKRVAELMQSAGPRSLQVLSAVYPHIDIAKSALQALIVSMLEGSRPDREAVVWVYEHKPDLVDDLLIPFAALRDMSEDSIVRFAQNVVRNGSEKLLRDAATVVSTSRRASSPTVAAAAAAAAAGAAVADDSADGLAETNVMRVLLAALSSLGPAQFPPSDKALADLVALVAPAMHQRVPGAKKILAKLLSQSQVQYHQAKQRLLVPTPSEKGQAALVFEFNDASHEPVVLQRPQKALLAQATATIGSQMVFSADGKSVYMTTGHGRVVWHFGGALRALFRSKHTIEPVIEQ